MANIFFKGKMFTYDDVCQAMARFDRERRKSFTSWRTYAIKYEGRDYPPKEILRMTVNDSDIPPGGEATNHYFRDLGFKIGEIEDKINSPSEEALDTSLSLERDLESHLVADLSQIETGLQLFKENGLLGQQLDAKPAGRIDILAISNNNELVVIELKAGEADRQVCGQILAYMNWVKDTLAGPRKVRGIIIANEFSERLRLAVKTLSDVKLRKYSVKFNFVDG